MPPSLSIATFAILGLTVWISALAFRRPDLELQEKLIFCPRRILAGKEGYRLLTLALLHADWRHLFFNMLSLYLFGEHLEIIYGPWLVVTIYLGSILGGSLLSLFLHRNHHYTAYGASGGVCGVIFASIFLLPGGGIHLYLIPVAIPGWLYAILFLVGSFYALKNRNDGIGHDAHLGGALSGLLIATVLHPWIVFLSPWLYAATVVLALALMVYLFFNPLFLPLRAFQLPRLRFHRRAPGALPRHRRAALETDRILEKIALHGLESLTSEERNHLHQNAKLQQRRRETSGSTGLPGPTFRP